MRNQHDPRPLALALSALLTAACSGGSQPRPLAAKTQLVQYATCAALEADLQDMLIDEADTTIARLGDDRFLPPFAEGDAAAGGDDDGGGREEGVDYSGTNNQEDGVDEADFVKTDGYHVYALNGNRLHIFGVPAFGELVPESVTPIEGHPTQLLVDRDAEKAAVFSIINVHGLPAEHPLRALVGQAVEGSDGWYWRIPELTKITILDVADRAHPALVREVFVEGWYQTAREHEGSVRLAAYSWMDVPALYRIWDWYYQSGEDKAYTQARVHAEIRAMDLADLVPQLYVRTPDGQFTTESLTTAGCRSFYRPTDSHARGVASIISFDLFGDVLAFDADHVVSNWATFYASTDTLVLAEAAHDWWWYWWWNDDPEHLNVHAFDISTPGETTYLASGRVEGWLFDQFSIDEEDGYLRLATTTDMWRRWWLEDPPASDNHVWVLAQQGSELVPVGHVDGIASGERITAARLLGDKGFLVTFEQIDPLWTLDLSDPTDPRVIGELEVPGFSTYLHPLAGDHLLSIGVGGDENGANWKTQISLFDVRDFAHPALASALALDMGDEWGWSEALWEHKAFTYFAPKQLLAVPQSSYRAVGTTPEGWTDYRYLSRLELVNVELGQPLSRKGAIDHSAYYDADPGDGWGWQNVDIRRSIFMGDFIYALSDKAVTVHRLGDLGLVTQQLLPGTGPYDSYWWW